MKDKKKEKIKAIAKQIVGLENERNACIKNCDEGKQKEVENKMEHLIANLSLLELLQIDEYIIEKNMLKK